MARRRANGEGTITRRKDGRYAAGIWLLTTTGGYKRVWLYGKTWDEVHNKLTEAKDKSRRGIPVTDRPWKVGEYLTYWLEEVVRPSRRRTTYALYEYMVRTSLIPGLGKHRLDRLSVATVQAFLNGQLRAGKSVRAVQIMRTVLSSALTRATREEIITRNVARLVTLPESTSRQLRPWTLDEIRRFLAAAQDDGLYLAFLLLVLYGLRRGEALGLRWDDIDLDAGEIQIRQQLQRASGELYVGPVKTRAGRRDLPLLPLVREALRVQAERQQADRELLGDEWQDTGLVITTRSGRPVEPRNLSRSFSRITAAAKLRRIRLHDLRHVTAKLLKSLQVPARDAQVILGHSRLSVTLEIYTAVDEGDRKAALGRINDLFDAGDN